MSSIAPSAARPPIAPTPPVTNDKPVNKSPAGAGDAPPVAVRNSAAPGTGTVLDVKA